MKPHVSIVIPTYNRASDLNRALRSVLNQTYSCWEALIIDNHSSDYTDDVVRGFNDSRMKLFKIYNNGVIAASRNLGINHARGDYVAFLDSDDWWMPQKLEKSLKYLDQGADVVYHDLLLVTKTKQRIFWRKTDARNLKSPVFKDLLINGNTLSNSSVVISRDILKKINGFSEDPNLIAAEDYDGWLRAARVTEKFKKIPQTLGYYWAGGGNISNPDRMLRTLGAIEERYANAILDLNAHQDIYWLSYTRGKAYYRLGSYERAKQNLHLIPWNRAPFSIHVKGRLMLLMIDFYYHTLKL